MNNVLNKIFGTVKIINGITSLIAYSTVLIALVRNTPEDIYTAIGGYIGAIIIFFYCFYLFYSGLTDFANKHFKNLIIIIGLIINVIILIFWISFLFTSDYDTFGKLIIVLIIGFTLMIKLRDIYRLKSKKDRNITVHNMV